jgi:hypothetical protein
MNIADFETIYHTDYWSIGNNSGTKVKFNISGSKNIVGVTAYPIGTLYGASVSKKGIGTSKIEASVTFGYIKTGLDTIPLEICATFEDSTE